MTGLRVSIDVMPGGMISPQACTRQGWSWLKLPSSRTVNGWLPLPSATQASHQDEIAVAWLKRRRCSELAASSTPPSLTGALLVNEALASLWASTWRVMQLVRATAG